MNWKRKLPLQKNYGHNTTHFYILKYLNSFRMQNNTPFPIGNLSTSELLGNAVNDKYFMVSKVDFTQYKKVAIETLHPRQQYVCGETLNHKMKGKNYTLPFVLITNEGNILIDGHHTVIVKKAKGYKYVYAQCCTL